MNVDQDEVTLPFIAIQLRLSYLQVYRLLLTGQLQGRKQQGRWLVSRESYQRFLAQYQEQH